MLITSFVRNRLKRHKCREGEIEGKDIELSSTILFSVFARYGDSVIAFQAIKEFIETHPGKRYLVFTTHQSIPYARRILGSNAEIHSVNKRRNPLKFLALAKMLGKLDIDIGFSPRSHGEDSEFFLTFAKKFQSYKSFSRFTREYNLYERTRMYLRLPEKKTDLCPSLPDHAHTILLNPFSTDRRKNLDRRDLSILINQIAELFCRAEITIALFKDELSMVSGLPGKRFLFGKGLRKSEEFLKLLESSDLLIGVDSGPLHLADALGVRAIGIFGPTAPETILNRDSRVVPLRIPEMKGVFCDVRNCTNPVCMHRLFDRNLLGNRATVNFQDHLSLEATECKLRR